MKVLSPWDPLTAASAVRRPPRRRAARPAAAGLPDRARAHRRPRGQWRRLQPLGAPGRDRADAPRAPRRQLRRRPRPGASAPTLGWTRLASRARRSSWTFHAYGPNALPQRFAIGLGARRRFNQLSARIAVSEAAEWTGRRWYGGNYEIIPNGGRHRARRGPGRRRRRGRAAAPVRRPGRGAQGAAGTATRAFEALVEHVPARLVVVGTAPEDVARSLADPDALAHIDALGGVSPRPTLGGARRG